MELSIEVLQALNQASDWWTASSRVVREARQKTLELVHTLLKEVGEVEFDETHRELEHLYYNGEFSRIVRIRKLYVDEYDDVIAVLADFTEVLLKDIDGLPNSQIWNAITDSLGLSGDY